MIKEITFITGNQGKFEEACEIFEPTGISLSQEKVEAPEIQSKDSREISKFTANYISKILNKPFFVMDRSFHIKALKGFPGPFVKFINQWLSPSDVIKLVEGKETREANWITCISCFIPGKEIKTFIGEQSGSISLEPGENKKWAVDSVFIPNGSNKVLSSFTTKESSKFWNANSAWQELISFLKSN